MSAASDLIERLEAETGQCVDDPGSLALVGLFGALSREMGLSPKAYTPHDDVAAGIFIQHQMSPEWEQGQAAREMLAQLLSAGMSPDDAVALLGD